MHPPIGIQQTQLCKELVQDFQACHKTNFMAKFTNKCSDLKSKLDKCLLAEYEERRKENGIKAAARMKQYEENNKIFEKLRNKTEREASKETDHHNNHV